MMWYIWLFTRENKDRGKEDDLPEDSYIACDKKFVINSCLSDSKAHVMNHKLSFQFFFVFLETILPLLSSSHPHPNLPLLQEAKQENRWAMMVRFNYQLSWLGCKGLVTYTSECTQTNYGGVTLGIIFGTQRLLSGRVHLSCLLSATKEAALIHHVLHPDIPPLESPMDWFPKTMNQNKLLPAFNCVHHTFAPAAKTLTQLYAGEYMVQDFAR